MSVTDLRPALRAIDEREIRKYGPLGAVLRAPSQDSMVRRAGLALFDVQPHELLPVLGMWQIMHPQETS